MESVPPPRGYTQPKKSTQRFHYDHEKGCSMPPPVKVSDPTDIPLKIVQFIVVVAVVVYAWDAALCIHKTYTSAVYEEMVKVNDAERLHKSNICREKNMYTDATCMDAARMLSPEHWVAVKSQVMHHVIEHHIRPLITLIVLAVTGCAFAALTLRRFICQRSSVKSD